MALLARGCRGACGGVAGCAGLAEEAFPVGDDLGGVVGCCLGFLGCCGGVLLGWWLILGFLLVVFGDGGGLVGFFYHSFGGEEALEFGNRFHLLGVLAGQNSIRASAVSTLVMPPPPLIFIEVVDGWFLFREVATREATTREATARGATVLQGCPDECQ